MTETTRPSTLARRFLAAPMLAAALAAGGAAQAATTTIDFDNTGFTLASSCGSTCYDVSAVGSVASSSGSWAYFAQGMVDTSSMLFAGTWEFQDLVGSNNLSGSFTGAVLSATSQLAVGSIDYLVSAGGGLYAGATGTGQSTVSVLPDFSYSEKGSLLVTAVPEPGTWAMMGLGLLGVAFAARRRKA